MGTNEDSNQLKRARLEDVCDCQSDEELCDVLGSEDEFYLESDSEEEEENLNELPSSSASENQKPIWSTTGELRNIKFNDESQGFNPLATTNPIDYFVHFVDESFLNMVCEEINLYAERLRCSEGVMPQSLITSWKELTVAELKIFLGLLLLMGVIQIPELPAYWDTDPLFQIKKFAENMSKNRFLSIFKCLNFSEETDEGDPLLKIEKIAEYFNRKMNECYIPTRELLLDESMVYFRGYLRFPQFITRRGYKDRIKLCMLTDSNGIVLKYCVCTKKHMDDVVMKLMEGKLLKGHSLYMTDCYNSYNLAKKLLENDTYCTGMLRKRLKENPKEVVEKNLNKDENISRFCDKVHLGKWKDTRPLIYITTKYENKMSNVTNAAGLPFVAPEALIQYKKYMLDVDLQEKMMACYPCERIPLQWHKKIFVHTLHLLLINSHKIYNKYSGAPKMSLHNYYLAIVNTLLAKT